MALADARNGRTTAASAAQPPTPSAATGPAPPRSAAPQWRAGSTCSSEPTSPAPLAPPARHRRAARSTSRAGSTCLPHPQWRRGAAGSGPPLAAGPGGGYMNATVGARSPSPMADGGASSSDVRRPPLLRRAWPPLTLRAAVCAAEGASRERAAGLGVPSGAVAAASAPVLRPPQSAPHAQTRPRDPWAVCLGRLRAESDGCPPPRAARRRSTARSLPPAGLQARAYIVRPRGVSRRCVATPTASRLPSRCQRTGRELTQAVWSFGFAVFLREKNGRKRAFYE